MNPITNPSLLALMQLMPPQPKTKTPRLRMGTPRSGTTKANGAVAVPTMSLNGMSVRPLNAAQNKSIGRASVLPQQSPAVPASPMTLEQLLKTPPQERPLPANPMQGAEWFDANRRGTANIAPLLNQFVPTGDTLNLATPSKMQQYTALQQKALPRSPLAIKAAENKADLARISEQLSRLESDFAPFDQKPYVPPALPVRQQLALPDRPNLQPPDEAQIMSALAGLLSPQNAGNFYAVPYEAANAEEERQYADLLKRTAFDQGQADTRYGDALTGRGDTIQTDMYNRDLDWRQREANRKLELEKLGLSGSIKGTQSLLDALTGTNDSPGLIAQDEESARFAQQANQIGGEINSGLAGNQQQIQRYLGEMEQTVRANKEDAVIYRSLLRMAQEARDKEAQRKLTQRGQDINRELGVGRNGISQQNANTSRMNADTTRTRQTFTEWKAQQDALNKRPTEQEFVEKSPDVKYFADLSKNLLATIARTGTGLPTATDAANLANYEAERVKAIGRARQQYQQYQQRIATPALPMPQGRLTPPAKPGSMPVFDLNGRRIK